MLPEDQGTLFRCIVSIHQWLLWVSTNALGQIQLVRFFQSSFVIWEAGREGAVEGGVQGGVFKEMGVPSAVTMLAAVQKMFKSTWAAEFTLILEQISRGTLSPDTMSTQQTMVFKGDMSGR